MPVALVKAALMSSSAFFIEAAAKTVSVLSCAAEGCGASQMAPAKRLRASRRVKCRLSMAVLQQVPPGQHGLATPGKANGYQDRLRQVREPPFRQGRAGAQRYPDRGRTLAS